MSGPQAKPFKARLGLDANNEKVINVKAPTELLDAVNLQHYIATNTVQTFDATRIYPTGFIVQWGDRLYKSKADIGVGAFNLTEWTEIHAFDLWQRITGNFTAEPGNCLLLNTSAGSVTVTLPNPAEEGDIVSILDEGFAKSNPISLNAGTNTFDGGLATTYSINSSDMIQVIFLGGTWRVNRIVKETFQYLNANTIVTPNSWNLVQTTAARTITLPVTPIQGQWVVVADGSVNARNFNITVSGNGKNIQGAASYLIKRFGEIVYFIYDAAAGEWKYHSNSFQDRIMETTTPFACERILVTLDSSAKTMTLPSTGLVSGDWVEVITKYQDEVATGSLVVSAGGANYFRLNGGTQNTTAYRIKERGRFLFLYKASEWTVIPITGMQAVPNLTSGNMVANTLVTLVGAAGQTIYLPSADQVQIGDTITARLSTVSNSVTVSVQSTSNDLLDTGTSVVYAAGNNEMVVTFVYRGWNGTKYVWETINHGNAYLAKTQNGNDIPDKGAFRTNLDVYSKSEGNARYLPWNGNAVSATQASNSDKLDNLDSTDFIQVKNPNTTAVDANTTTETRFTTNVNTPDGTSWQVVMFVDQLTGDKAQIAMSRTTTKIAYRSYAASTWTAWSFLDQGGNAATASKWNTARTITLTGDATGSVSIDGSANVSFATTVESANVNLEDLSVVYASMKDGVFVDKSGNYTHFLAKDGVGTGIGLKIDNTTGEGIIAYWNGTVWVTSKLYTDDYHPTADKWTTARTITFTGGLTGSASIDGSGDVSIDTTVNPGAHTHTIANVTGLQTALDGKLGTTAKAADSELLDGVNGADYRKAIAATNTGEDPSTTVTELILTNHVNTPDGGLTYWFIDTKFYQTRAVGSNRFQFATQFNGGVGIQFRNYVSGVWSDWAAVAAIVDGATYDINVLGTSGEAAEAVKLKTARNINGVAFDGTANITVADATKLPLSGGVMTGTISRSGTGYKRVDHCITKQLSAVASATGTIKIKLPVTWNSTMMRMKIVVNDYADGKMHAELEVGGYNYTSGTPTWMYASAVSNGADLSIIGNTVRFGHDGTTNCILIGTTGSVWNYPAISVTDFVGSFTGSTAGWETGWDASIITSETGITNIVSTTIDTKFARVDRNNVFTQPQTINATGTYLRNVTGNYGTMLYQDASAFYLMVTNSGDQYGSYNALRPFQFNLSTGNVTMNHAVTVNGNFTASSTATVTGVLTTTAQQTMNGGCLSAGWLRTSAAVGWYSETYGGGWNMQDSTWIRAYGSKALLVSNQIAATGNITAYYSDKRLKENLKPIENAVETVKSWTGYHYNANVLAQSFGYDPNKKEIGLLAQDVQATTPEAVEQAPFDLTATPGKSLTGQNYLTLKYDRLVPILVEAIKEQDKEIQELKQQVQFLLDEFKKLSV